MDQKHIPRPPQYIGDGIYAQENEDIPGEIVLTTDSHILANAGNRIFVGPEYVQALCNYMLSVQLK